MVSCFGQFEAEHCPAALDVFGLEVVVLGMGEVADDGK